MRTWTASLAVVLSLLTACGARSSLDAPPSEGTSGCPDTSTPSLYVVSATNELLRFDASSRTFAVIGTLDCPWSGPPTPPPQDLVAMAVRRNGEAYVVNGNGELFAVSTDSASCAFTGFVFDAGTFGQIESLGFAADADGQHETLFVAGYGVPGEPGHVGTLDTTTFDLHPVGPLSPAIGPAALTGTGDGRLFAFGAWATDGDHLAEVDKTDASIVSDTLVPAPTDPGAWALASLDGDFYFFTAMDGAQSKVGRLHPADGSFDDGYAVVPGQAITGAGASICTAQ